MESKYNKGFLSRQFMGSNDLFSLFHNFFRYFPLGQIFKIRDLFTFCMNKNLFRKYVAVYMDNQYLNNNNK